MAQEREPADIDDGTRDDAGDGAVEVEAAPEEAQENGRPEGSAEDAPGVCYEGMMEPEFGAEAMRTDRMAMTRTTMRPAHIISRSLALFLRKTGL